MCLFYFKTLPQLELELSNFVNQSKLYSSINFLKKFHPSPCCIITMVTGQRIPLLLLNPSLTNGKNATNFVLICKYFSQRKSCMCTMKIGQYISDLQYCMTIILVYSCTTGLVLTSARNPLKINGGITAPLLKIGLSWPDH